MKMGDIIRHHEPLGGQLMSTSRENRLAIQKRYDEKHRGDYKAYYIKFNKGAEGDLIEYLESVPNKQGFIKDLIRQHMESGN